MSYEVLDYDWDKFTPANDYLLVIWEEAKESLLGGKLVRPDTHKGIQYTGIIKKASPHVDEDLKPGKRIFFEQFSSPLGFIDSKTKKRMAIIRESACLAIIPQRAKIGSGEAGFNYDV